MINPFKRASPDPAPPSPTLAIRETLFGDMPLEAWPSEEFTSQPWAAFVAARDALKFGDRAAAVQAWTRITQMPNLESRHHAQAYHFLRTHGGVGCPPEQAKRLLGAVLEVPMENGLDLLAAYPEHTARYYNFSGAGVVWEHPDASLDPTIDALLAASQRVLDAIGPWDKPRPPVPEGGQWRLNFLSPAGLHFGQGQYAVLANDPMASPVIDAATALMQALVARTS